MFSSSLPLAALALSSVVLASPTPRKVATTIPINRRYDANVFNAARRDASKHEARSRHINFSPSPSPTPSRRSVPADPFDIQDLRGGHRARGSLSGVAPLTDFNEQRG